MAGGGGGTYEQLLRFNLQRHCLWWAKPKNNLKAVESRIQFYAKLYLSKESSALLQFLLGQLDIFRNWDSII